MAKLTPVKTVISYNFELTEEEVKMIFSLVGSVVGGGPSRLISDAIYDSICEGMNWDYNDFHRLQLTTGTVTTKDSKNV